MPLRRPADAWGTHLWGFIHTLTVIDFEPEMNEIHQRRVIQNLKAIPDVFPCAMCLPTYQEALAKLDPLPLRESMVLFKWSWELHNAVNKKLSKPDLSYEDAIKRWTKEI